MNVGLALKNIRLRSGITQTELADRTGLSQTWISIIEKSKKEPEMKTIHKILKALNTDYGDFIIESLEPGDFNNPEKMEIILPAIKNMIL